MLQGQEVFTYRVDDPTQYDFSKRPIVIGVLRHVEFLIQILDVKCVSNEDFNQFDEKTALEIKEVHIDLTRARQITIIKYKAITDHRGRIYTLPRSSKPAKK